MKDNEIIIDTNEYFLEIVDESKSTIGYTVVFPQKLLTKIIKQNKQLTRKTQECEELKDLTYRLENQRETYYKEFLRIKSALEEIKEIVSSTLDCGEWVGQGDNKMAKILDIINKAKESE